MILRAGKNFYQAITSNAKYLFVLLWCAIGLLCLPAYKAGFNGDFEGLLDYYNKTGFWDFINSKGFSVKSMYQVTHLQLYALITVFGTHRIPWFLLLTGLHALNASFVFVFCKRLFTDFKLYRAAPVALVAALLFAFNPNVTEITIWKGGYHYLPGLLAQLLILCWTHQFLKTQHNKYVWLIAIVYFLSSFTLEIFYLTPWFALLLILACYWKSLISKQVFQGAIIRVFLLQLCIFMVHLLSFRLRFGTWVAHYGTINEFFFTSLDLLPKLPKYLATLLGFTAYLPAAYSIPFYGFFNNPVVYYTCYGIAFFFVFFILLRFRHFGTQGQMAAFFFGLMMFCVAIVSPISFDEIMQLYNSRRCYELSFPVYALLSLSLFSLFPRKQFASVIIAVYLLACLGFSLKKSLQWREANKVQMAILRNYKWQDEKNVLILNLPCYYKDIRVIPTSKWDEFQESLAVFGYDTSKNKMQYVSSYNMMNPWDGAHVIMQDSNTLKVTLNQWGSWWMYDLGGARDFENESYRLEMTDVGHEYLLHLKKPAKEYTILFQQGESWKKVDVTKRPEEEQW